MTSELVQRAREQLEHELAKIDAFLESTDEVHTSQEAIDEAHRHRRFITTHKAEFEEWGKFVEEVEAKEKVDPDYIAKFGELVREARVQKRMLIIKAKRLLGVSE